MVLPANSSPGGHLLAAAAAAPEEMPRQDARLPAQHRAAATASPLSIGSTGPGRDRSRVAGMKPAPMPWIWWGPGMIGLPARAWLMTGLVLAPHRHRG